MIKFKMHSKYNVTCSIRAVHVNNHNTHLVTVHDIILKQEGMAHPDTVADALGLNL